MLSVKKVIKGIKKDRRNERVKSLTLATTLGAAAGAITAMFIAPKSEEINKTLNNVKDKVSDTVEKGKEKVDELIKEGKDKFDAVKKDIKDGKDKLQDTNENIKEDLKG